MYKSAKSCVAINGSLTDNFSCLIGVRQGENLSPLSFSLYLNDLQEFLQEAHMGLTHSRRHFQYIHVSVDGTFFKYLLFMTSYNTSYLGLRPVPSK